VQVLTLIALGIKAVAVTKDNLLADPAIWEKVRDGHYQLIYASPETLLDARGYFMTEIAGRGSRFEKRLVAIAIDECHLIWDWEHFRVQYKNIGKLRMTFDKTPIACLSATLATNVAGYVHSVCQLRPGTTRRYSLPLRRDNIDIVVSSVAPNDQGPLLDLISSGAEMRQVLEMPKTLVFIDDIEEGIRLCLSLRSRLARQFGDEVPERFVECYYGSLDAAKKVEILQNIMSGKTRIVICTDAFGMGIDVPDIGVVIQWHLTPRCSMTSLCQRIGRAARNPSLKGIAVIYVSSSFFTGLPADWRNLIGRWDEDLDSACAQTSTSIALNRMGLPVTPNTRPQTRQLLLSLYRAVSSLRESLRAVRERSSGSVPARAPKMTKLDPPLIWFILTKGCRHRVLGAFFTDPANFDGSHRSWCCDSCAATAGPDFGKHSTFGISADISILQSIAPSDTTKRPRPTVGPEYPDKVRTEEITPRHIIIIKKNFRFLRLGFCLAHPTPWMSPDAILPDKALDAVAERAKYIVSTEDLVKELEKAGLEQKRSLLTMGDVNTLYGVLDNILARPAPLQTILPRPSTVRLVPQASSLPSTLPLRECQEPERLNPRRPAIIPGVGKENKVPLVSDAAVREQKAPSASDAVLSAKRKPLQELDVDSVRKRLIKLPSRYTE